MPALPCQHIYWSRKIVVDGKETNVRWCSRCGSIFHKVRLKNGKWSLRSRWIHPRK